MTRIILSVLLLTLGLGDTAFAQQIRSFPFNGTNGSLPRSSLVADEAGNLFGTTSEGGLTTCFPYSCGVIFELSPPMQGSGGWTETTIYSFSSLGGADPIGNLTIDQSGNLYGTTAGGGSSDDGVVFELSPPSQPGGSWIEAVLYDFGSVPNDGVNPEAGLTFDAEGNLFGTTNLGGQNGGGVVFELSPPPEPGGPWTETILYNFAFPPEDGRFPGARVVLDSSGNLYGTTSEGGLNNDGTVFQLTPQPGGMWSETVLHSFGSGSDGLTPESGLTLTQSGALVGTTPSGGLFNMGNIFALSPPRGGNRTYGVLYQFGMIPNDGNGPHGDLIIQNGQVLYGTTMNGGLPNRGTIFQLKEAHPGAWTETILYDFSQGGGDAPMAGLLLHNGSLFGTASGGGFKNNGTAFQLSP